MKPLKNMALALLAVSFMASCSSTRPAGSSSGTTGMSSGSSSDLSTTSTTTTTTYDASVPGSYGNVSTVATTNYGPYEATAYGSGNQSRWSGMGTSYDPSAERTPFQYFMNGYQGPLDYVSFSNNTTAQAFISLAAENDAREVELSKIAQQKGSSAEVRAFADMMVNDHSRSNQELMNVASAAGVTIPTFNFYASGSNPGSYNSSTYMGTSSNATSVSGSSSMSSSTPAYNGDPALKGDPKISIPLANDLRDISGFPPEQANKTAYDAANDAKMATGATLSTNSTPAATSNGSITQDPKITPPLANDLRDISGLPPEQATKTAYDAANDAKMATGASLSTNSAPARASNVATVNSGSGSSNWSATGNSSMTTTSGSTWGSNNSASAMATMNEITALNNLTGAAFDTQYARMMIQDHYQAIQLFKSAAQSTDPQVKAYAEKTLPVLMAHYDQARRLK
jgi:predicted outer membrane protein